MVVETSQQGWAKRYQSDAPLTAKTSPDVTQSPTARARNGSSMAAHIKKIYIYIYILQDTVMAQECNDIMPSSHQFGAKEHIVMVCTSEATVCYVGDCLL